MSPRRFSLLMSLALLVIVAALNVAVTALAPAMRMDLTSDRRFSLQAPTRALLSGMSEPIELQLYASPDLERLDPNLGRYAGQVRQMLAAFAAGSQGRIRVLERPAPRFSEAEAQALAAGIRPSRSGPGGASALLAIEARNAVNERAVSAPLIVADAPHLERDIARLIATLEQGGGLRIGLISSLSGAADFDPGRELGRIAEVTPLRAGFSTVPARIDALAILHPWELSAGEAAAVDAYIADGGRAVIAVDPAALFAAEGDLDDPLAVFRRRAPSRSDLAPLFSAWGVQISRSPLAPVASAQTDRWPPPLSARASSGAILSLFAPGAVSAPGGVSLLTAIEDSAPIEATSALAGSTPPPDLAPQAGARPTLALRMSRALPRLRGLGAGVAAPEPSIVTILADVDVLATPAGANFLESEIASFGRPDPLAALRPGPAFARPVLDDLESGETRTAIADALALVEAQRAVAEARIAAGDPQPDAPALLARSLALRAEQSALDARVEAQLRRSQAGLLAVNIGASLTLLALLAGAVLMWRRKRRLGDEP